MPQPQPARVVALALLRIAMCAAAPAGLPLNSTSFYSHLHTSGNDRWFVLFFSPQCGHCSAMLPAWSALEQQLAITSTVRLASVDATAEKALADRLEVHGYPTMSAVEGRQMHEYDGGRSTEELHDFITSEDLAGVARNSRPLPSKPTPWDPLLRMPDATLEILAFAAHTSWPASAILLALLVGLGAALSSLLRPLDAQFITVECPPEVAPGQSFTVEFVTARSRLLPGGRRQRMQVVAPAGISPGQTFFVPLVRPPSVRPVPLEKAKAQRASEKAKAQRASEKAKAQ
jgi:thiol-disulfide isomerase/thioredoxin